MCSVFSLFMIFCFWCLVFGFFLFRVLRCVISLVFCVLFFVLIVCVLWNIMCLRRWERLVFLGILLFEFMCVDYLVVIKGVLGCLISSIWILFFNLILCIVSFSVMVGYSRVSI